jgi:hypothetical protein
MLPLLPVKKLYVSIVPLYGKNSTKNKIPQSTFLPCGIAYFLKNYFTFTFMVTVLVFPFSRVTFAFTVAVPFFFAVTLPLFETVATDFFEVV